MFEFSFERIDLKEVKNNNYNLVGSAYRDTKNIIPTNQKDCYRKNHTTW
ncbi:hypothetical protein [Rickettsia bellii]|uniref:Succinyl-diaminopimelate desuccinylase domain protein n=3 Tax=Rickettsia TaxID=780 RepID=A0A0F3QJ82_RICBE|nr:hypothetical protein [Rickettsia bellii]KJV90522.1 succinyl-diaminopimelate desuccinylase domain protein [Rickettsia bellii str. RML An4]KJV92598.1 succinyl-diaminopimelate desuccinylase domain protein [Rickettsia bellii str. RML Mogi]HJD60655.1 hypothetical protein [Rickettsia endosymbiont of Columbicola hoogstraali]